MPNADSTPADRAEEAGVSLATYTETRGHLHRGVRTSYSSSAQHVPGDTTTPPAPGAVWIGTGDA